MTDPFASMASKNLQVCKFTKMPGVSFLHARAMFLQTPAYLSIFSSSEKVAGVYFGKKFFSKLKCGSAWSISTPRVILISDDGYFISSN